MWGEDTPNLVAETMFRDTTLAKIQYIIHYDYMHNAFTTTNSQVQGFQASLVLNTVIISLTNISIIIKTIKISSYLSNIASHTFNYIPTLASGCDYL